MDLGKGSTIFDKIGLDYDQLRQSENPIKPIKDYYRAKLIEGQELWWLDNEEYKPDSLIFKIWNTISKKEKENYKIHAYAMFPEILGKHQSKFDNFTLWLSVRKRIICPNVRDLFTAGGRQDIIVEGVELKMVPKVMVKFILNIDKIVNAIKLIELDEFNEIWRTKFKSKKAIEQEWINKVLAFSHKTYDFEGLDLGKWLFDKLKAQE